ncbi:MAG TPA: cytochrome c [Ideonella sp.]|nr:cytochrome c [Ideonella sp.]
MSGDMHTPEIQPQQRREHHEPEEAGNPMPWFVIVLTALLLGFGVVYLARTSITTPAEWGDGRSAAELQKQAPAAGAAVDGAAVYASRCVACHQAAGSGLAGAFPPLAGSEWVAGKDSTLAAIVLHGIDGPLTVKGSIYHGTMPSFGAQLQDAEIAAVLTHVRSHWGNAAAAVSVETVAAARQATAARSAPFKGDAELAALK